MAKCENCYHAEACGNYPNTGLPEKSRQRLLDKGCEHYKDKSLIVELPCRLGDEVYYHKKSLDNKLTIVLESIVSMFNINPVETLAVISYNHALSCDDFGKTVFLSREEAERALEAGNG